MARQVEILTQDKVAALIADAKPGLYADGGGLGLRITASGGASWSFRYTLQNRTREAGLGAASVVTVVEARKRARAIRNQVHAGVDVIAAKRAAEAAQAEAARPVVTFKAAAEEWIALQSPSWKNPVHAAQVPSTLAAHVYDVFGGKAVADVGLDDVVRALSPIWTKLPETARRVRQRIEAVLDYASAEGHRNPDAPNPARKDGPLKHRLTKQIDKVKHHEAIAYAALPAVLATLGGQAGVSAQCVAFTALTACRSGEARGMVWGEVDMDSATWTVPGSRMKAGLPHVVPLSAPALAILAARREATSLNPAPTALVFPSPVGGGELSDVAIGKSLKSAARNPAATIHGLRSSFRDWCGDETNTPREIAEAALAHKVAGETEASYRRGTALAKRRELMAAWGAYCFAPTVPTAEAA